MIIKIKNCFIKIETKLFVSVIFLLLTGVHKSLYAMNSLPFSPISEVEQFNVTGTAIASNGEALWIGSLNGIIVIRPGEYKIFNTSTGHTSANHVSDIAIDSKGDVWVSFVGGGVLHYDSSENTSYHVQDKYDIQDLDCYDILHDEQNDDLLFACDSDLYSFDIETRQLTEVVIKDMSGKKMENFYKLALSTENQLLIGTWGQGLQLIDDKNLVATLLFEGPDYIHDIEVDSFGEDLLIASEKGVYEYSFLSKSYNLVTKMLGSELLDVEVFAITQITKNKFIFVFSVDGIFEYDISNQTLEPLNMYQPLLDNDNIGPTNEVKSLFDGLVLGLSAVDKGFYILPSKYDFASFFLTPRNIGSRTSMVANVGNKVFIGEQTDILYFDIYTREINSFTEDIGYAYFMYDMKGKHYLISTYENGFVKVNRNGEVVEKNYMVTGLPENSVSRFTEILKLGDDDYLLGTDFGELKGVFRGNFTDGFEQIYDGGVIANFIKLNGSKVLFAKVYDGLVVYDLITKEFYSFKPQVEDLYVDCAEKVTENLVFLCLRRNKPLFFNLSTGEYSQFDYNGIDLRSARDAQLDAHGNLWIASARGLFVYDVSNKVMTQLSGNEGISSSDFASDSMLLNGNKLIIPGNKGIVEIDVDKAKAFLDFKKSQETQSFITRAEYILDEQSESQEASVDMMAEGISLPHSNIVLKLKFSHNNFLELEDLAFDVRMLGLNSDWTTLEVGEYTSTYTTLQPGDYEFQVRVNDPRSMAAQPVETIHIEVSPPWWQTTWAYVSYLLLLIIALHVFSWFRNRRLLAHNKLLTKEVSERTATISTLLKQKQTFFANVSHEFRTPLSLIMGPLDAISDAIKGGQHDKNLAIMRRNTSRLMKLVDQILDLAKFETSQSLPKQVYELKSAMDIMAASFTPLLDNKQQKLVLRNFSETKVSLVEDSFEIIMTNLISNAIKYCPPGTEIVISMQASNKNVEIEVADNGPGISEDNLKVLFERFTRFDVAENIQGSGIGLALVKQLVNNNDGEITVDSTPGNGTTFNIRFPLNVKADARVTKTPTIQVLDSEFIDETSPQSDSSTSKEKAKSPQKYGDNTATTKPRLLIVEDNADLRSYFADSLKDCYELDLAVNGEQGWQKAQDAIPDLILSDVLMPIMDGYELANRIRSDEVTSHIPIILITAKGDDLSRMKGWEEQVDDYISKPFKMSELKIRIKRLLSIRDILRKKHTSAVANHLATKDKEAISFQTKKDADFFVAFEKVVGEHFDDEHFTRAEASQYLNMVPRQLNRKLSALMDYNFSEYLRKYRLQKSTDLLLAGKQVTEVAYDVGFNSPSYFSSCFKAEFDETPSQYVENRVSGQYHTRKL